MMYEATLQVNQTVYPSPYNLSSLPQTQDFAKPTLNLK